MDREARVAQVRRSTTEVLTPEELSGLFESHEHPRAYIGFEPSGRLTVAHLVCIRKMLDLEEAGCELTILLADWHAWINDKLGGDLGRIEGSGRYMQAVFESFGLASPRTRYRWGHELVARPDYWARVVRIAKATTLARTRRAMTVLGRSEEDDLLDTSWLLYPAMQAADIFEIPVDLAYAGLDQRRAHVLAREVAHRYGWPVPAAVHTPLVSSLKGGGRMDASLSSVDRKMSKSDPAGAITLPATTEEIEGRVQGAWCVAGEVDGNPVVELARYVVLPWTGTLAIERAAKHGGPVAFSSEEEFLSAWSSGAIHPADLKGAVARALPAILAPANRALEHVPAPEVAGLRADRPAEKARVSGKPK